MSVLKICKHAGRYGAAVRHILRAGCVLALAGICSLGGASDAAAADVRTKPFWTPTVSEETPPAICRRGYAVQEVKCSGPYCDNKQLLCARYTRNSKARPRFSWSRSFSEEGTAATSDNRRLVTGVSCSGSYCDNLSLQFALTSGIRISGCGWNNRFFSEEGGKERRNVGSCGSGRFVAGVRCRGAYCDNLDLYCCRVSE